MPKEKKHNNFSVFVIIIIAVFVIYYYLSQSPNSVSFAGQATKLYSCTETDGGDVSAVKGVTTHLYKDKRWVREDFCNTAYNLTEYYCYKNQLQIHPYTCRCSEGACI